MGMENGWVICGLVGVLLGCGLLDESKETEDRSSEDDDGDRKKKSRKSADDDDAPAATAAVVPAAAEPAAAAPAAGSTGIEACDLFLSAYEKCMPQAQAQLAQYRQQFAAAAGIPQARAAVEQSCQQLQAAYAQGCPGGGSGVADAPPPVVAAPPVPASPEPPAAPPPPVAAPPVATPPVAAPTAVCGALNDVPEIPDTRSAPPTVAEWGQACAVNTQGAGSHPNFCTMTVVREWLNVTCRGDISRHQNMEAFGQHGHDYFEMFKPGSLGSFVVRLRKGFSQKVRICRGSKDRASLFVSWPPSAPKPLHIALGIGPACD